MEPLSKGQVNLGDCPLYKVDISTFWRYEVSFVEKKGCPFFMKDRGSIVHMN